MTGYDLLSSFNCCLVQIEPKITNQLFVVWECGIKLVWRGGPTGSKSHMLRWCSTNDSVTMAFLFLGDPGNQLILYLFKWEWRHLGTQLKSFFYYSIQIPGGSRRTRSLTLLFGAELLSISCTRNLHKVHTFFFLKRIFT